MKNVLILFLMPVCFAACSGGGSGTPATTKDSSTVIFPYTASLSSNFVPAKDSDVLVVLNSYKAWENGDNGADGALWAL